MKYQDIVEAEFLERPNRFIAWVKIADKRVKVHVKNTGRCRELLIPGARVLLEPTNNPNRKTKYSLISVYKGERLVNMDSQVPNRVVYEALRSGKIKGFHKLEIVKREVSYQHSRFDIYYKRKDIEGFIEVKGVTLEEDGIALFPDAPTKRGSKHIYELIEAKKEGYEATIFFLIQMENIYYFKPNSIRDPEFAKALTQAKEAGINIIGYNSLITRETIDIHQPITMDI